MGYLNEDGLATLVGKVKGQVVQLTAAEYRQIPAETKNTDNKIYFVEDDDYAYAIDNEPTLNSENLVKSGGVYNYTSKIGTGALTTTAQTLIPAVNELKAAVDTNTSDIAELNNDLTERIYIGSGASTPTGTITDMSYVRSGNIYHLVASISGMSLTANTNVWVRVPDTFPGNANFFTPLSVSYTGIVAVFRTQSGSGKYILIQSPTTLANVSLSIAGTVL